jgi:ribosomal protein S12 methylthiotransferase accessory factor
VSAGRGGDSGSQQSLRRLTTMPPLPAFAPTGQVPSAVEQATRRLGLRPRWQRIANGGPVDVWSCELVDAAGTTAFEAPGLGKGATPAQARVRALSEALERYVTGPMSLERHAVRLVTAELLGSSTLKHDASGVLLRQLRGSQLACHTYESLLDGHEESIPIFLGAPWYAGPDGRGMRESVGDTTDYHALSRYSVNSGYGLAPTLAQATLHALLETVERDACSLLTIRTFLAGQPPAVVDPRSLPEDLATLHAHTQRAVDATVHLIDATSDLGIPTVIAYVLPLGGGSCLRGQAASLSSHEAATGALTELLESFHARRHGMDQPPRLERLARYPPLHRCARFDFTDALAHARSTAFRERSSPMSEQAQLEEVVFQLAEQGFTPYRRRVVAVPENVSAVHTMVPGLERFFSVVKGALVLPGPRGRARQRA